MPKTRIVTGLKPSGKLHIGNYLGALKRAVELQNSGKYDCFYFIADYHALTQSYTPKGKSEEIYEMLVDALAVGLDPKKSTIFIQSHIPHHANLSWILNTITPVGRLEGMIEYKEKLSEGQRANVGLFDYPVLMAADVLIYKAKAVPVGEDQSQHLELTRDIARTFNARFGKTFPEPRAIHTKALRIMSLSDPAKKMSKSIPSGCLYLTDSPRVIRKKVKSAVTDSFSEVGYDEERRPAISNLVLIYSEFSQEPVEKVINRFKGAKYQEFKNELAELIVKKLEPIQARRKKLMRGKNKTLSLIKKGEERAAKISSATLAEVKKKVGLI